MYKPVTTPMTGADPKSEVKIAPEHPSKNKTKFPKAKIAKLKGSFAGLLLARTAAGLVMFPLVPFYLIGYMTGTFIGAKADRNQLLLDALRLSQLRMKKISIREDSFTKTTYQDRYSKIGGYIGTLGLAKLIANIDKKMEKIEDELRLLKGLPKLERKPKA